MKTWLLAGLLLIEVALVAPISGIEFDSTHDFLLSSRMYVSTLVEQAAPLLILVFGMTIILMTAGIDLSVGAMVAFIACVMSMFDGGPQFWYTALPVGLLVGLGLGLFNGLLISRFDVPPIIATLGTLFFYRGLAEIVMRGQERGSFAEVPGYEWFGSPQGALVLVGILFLLGGAYFVRSRWRREILMIGGNRVAARYAGIPVDWRLLQVYTLMGLLAFIAAVSYTARNASVTASALSGLELHVIVATVLGGTRVTGGHGTLSGSVIGVFLVEVLNEGLRGMQFHWGDRLPFDVRHLDYMLLGALLLVGVWLVGSGTRGQGVRAEE